MLDKILEVGAGFDWISPLASVIGDMVNGPSHTFLIPYGSSPLSGREIEIMLKRRGVNTWGLMVVSGTLLISVKAHQARWAQYLLEQAGIPIETPLPRRSPAPAARASAVARRSRILRRLGRL